MKEFYAEECGLDYGVVCYQEQTRQTVTRESLEEILSVRIVKFEIDFEREIIEYTYNEANADVTEEISLNDFFEIIYVLENQ